MTEASKDVLIDEFLASGVEMAKELIRLEAENERLRKRIERLRQCIKDGVRETEEEEQGS